MIGTVSCKDNGDTGVLQESNVAEEEPVNTVTGSLDDTTDTEEDTDSYDEQIEGINDEILNGTLDGGADIGVDANP